MAQNAGTRKGMDVREQRSERDQSETLGQPGLAQHPVRRVTRLDLLLNGKILACDGTVPDLMRPLTLTNRLATGRPEYLFENAGVVRHQAAAIVRLATR